MSIFIFLTRRAGSWPIALLVCAVALVVYIVHKLTKGKTFQYFRYEMNRNVLSTLKLIHFFGASALAMLLPNNYLNEIDFFRSLYDQNDFWIPLSILILLFFFLILFGAIITVLCKWIGLKKLDKEREPLPESGLST
jgi:cytosine/uracil/thiamine/allantoin permease